MGTRQMTHAARGTADADGGFAPGSIVEVRDEEWLVSSSERLPNGVWKVRCTGASELVRDTDATFLTDLDEVVRLDPEDARLVVDDSPAYRRTRLWLEAVLRKTPVPLHEQRLAVAHRMLLDDLAYQRRAVAQALSAENLRTRLLIADAVGLGKTLEIGMILAELARRGRADRVLVVTPRHVLEQMQWELWTRFAIPLVRLDSDGIARVRQQLPASRNPFTFFKKVIVSVDTLKSGRYRAHLEKHRWDVVVIDESHNLTNTGTLNNQLARVLAPNTDALILASATPHNGRPESFAELVNLLDPTAIANPADYDVREIRHLFVRRHRNSPDVANEVGAEWAQRPEPTVLEVPANAAEEAVAAELVATWLYPRAGEAPVTGAGSRLFPWTLAKAYLSSAAALRETIANRHASRTSTDRERAALSTLDEMAAAMERGGESKFTALVDYLRSIGIGTDDNRVVLFSERLATLRWLRRALPAALGLPDDAFAMLHGGLTDKEQMAVVERFQVADTPLRVLVAGDVASEGVNLHRRCHHLVHVDLPWSLIRIEQRNGRIDRYGQQHPPRIAALALTRGDEEFPGDVRVLTRLLHKEHAAHKALGDAASLMKLHSAEVEEREVTRALAAGRDIDEVVPDPVVDLDLAGFDELFDLGGQEDQPQAPTVDEGHHLFRSDLDFLREALREVYADPGQQGGAGVGWQEHPDEGLAELVPPPDLRRRLRVLPQSYLSDRGVLERMVLATTRTAGLEHLRKARERRGSRTLWPEAHYLGPLHPVIDWAMDKALTRLGRNEVPLVVGDVPHVTVLVLGTLTNARGQVVSRMTYGMQFLTRDGGPVVSDDALAVLADAGIRDGGINTGNDIEPDRWQWAVRAAVAQMRVRLDEVRKAQAQELAAPVWQAETRLEAWLAERTRLAEGREPGRRARELRHVERYAHDAKELVASLEVTGESGVRVLAVIVPREEAL